MSQASLETLYVVVSVVLVLFAGLMSGLSLGLMSQDKVDLEVGRGSTSVSDSCASLVAP